jgi:hypothetical protein
VVVPINWILGASARSELVGATCTVDLPTFAALVKMAEAKVAA